MALNIQLSDGLRNFLMDGGSFKQAFSGGNLKIYNGSQPATANAAITGTELVEITDASGTVTAEVASAGSVQLTVGSGVDTVATVTIAGIDVLGTAVQFNVSLNQTASDVADQINANPANYLVTASVSTDTVTLTAKPSTGALLNAEVVSTTGAITTVKVNMGTTVSGVDSVNGLSFEQDPTTGVLEKLASQTWSGTASATGTASHFRLYAAIADTGALDSAALYLRMDGTVGTSGADLNFGSVSFVDTEAQSIPVFTVTEPAA